MGRSVCASALSLMFRLLAIQEHFDAVRSSECGHLLTLQHVHGSCADRPWPWPMDVHTSLDVFGDLYKAHAIAATLGAEPVPEVAAKRLLAQANDAGGRDNITLVIVRFDQGDSQAGSQ
jgi:hypothetical protein